MSATSEWKTLVRVDGITSQRSPYRTRRDAVGPVTVTVIDGNGQFRSFTRSRVHPLCGQCTTRWDMTGRIRSTCATCKQIPLEEVVR